MVSFQKHVLLPLLASVSVTTAFTVTPLKTARTTTTHLSPLQALKSGTEILDDAKKALATLVVASALTVSTVLSPLPNDAVRAYESKDYASDTVTNMVKTLEESAGKKEKTLAAFEELAAIITEGKGVGGSVSPGGVQFERGFVSDEDTTIYNPGLTLLTESEKGRLLEAVVKNKQVSSPNSWSQDNQYGFEFLKQKLDPLNMYQLKGYMGIIPFYAAALYLGVIFVQQNVRSLFPAAYIAAVLALVLPAGILVALGP